ncbi:RING-H2 finger protein ATL57 [Abeliophyllum distichum]|uniref:RING-type E3 ubiquitin transferase n=1 Tax=Abeliophyllum distichum TaxID=126358 RepID=A0ABD1VUM8_9LAMI
MKPTTTVLIRRLVQQDGGADTFDGTLPASTPQNPIFQPINGTSATIKTPFSPTTSTAVDFSMALTILLLLTVLFFMAFFSVYIRRLADEDTRSSSDHRQRRNPSLPSPSNRKGLDPSTIKSLPLVACGVTAKHRIEECTICLSEFEDRDIVKIIPYCKHVFHPKCIDTWLSLHVTCPLCRSPQLFENVDEFSLDMKQQEDNNGV